LILDAEGHEQLHELSRWAKSTSDGSRADWPFVPSLAVWEGVQSDRGNCLGRACPNHSECFYFKARKQAFAANLLIVNHALFFSDLAVRNEGGGVLPDYDAVIFDEAHTLEDVAADFLGLSFSEGALDYLLNQLLGPRGQKGLLAIHGDSATFEQFEQTRQATTQFFQRILDWLGGQATKTTLRIRQPGIIPDTLSEPLGTLAQHLLRLSTSLKNEDEKLELTSRAERLVVMANSIQQWLTQGLKHQVYWLVTRGGRVPRVQLRSAPIDVGPALKKQLFQKVPTVVLTSATLSIGSGATGFKLIQKRLGLAGAETLQLGSPFDYQRLVTLHLFRDTLPDPATAGPAFEQAVLQLLPKYLRLNEGRALVLFTSYVFLRRSVEALGPQLQQEGMTLLIQSEGQAIQPLVEQFRRSQRPVLFGTSSFWQGIDIQGDVLSQVVITKLPFTVPDEPIMQARLEAIQERGGNPFLEYSVPEAIIRLKQGFGRLVRTQTDRGQVIIFDPRVLTKPYGRQFLTALPDCPRVIDGRREG
jgi:ATP-dependent DNA helicase DinG